jgi:hypothetical protein
METIFRIKSTELTTDFLNRIKALFKNEKELEIVISPVSDIENLEVTRNTVVVSEDEFKSLTNDLLNDK